MTNNLLLPLKQTDSQQQQADILARTPFTSQFMMSQQQANKTKSTSVVDLNATRSSNNDPNSDTTTTSSSDHHYSQLLNGLKNLSIKQQERVYSAS